MVEYKRIIFVRHGESTENIATSDGKSYDKNKIILTKKGGASFNNRKIFA